MKGTAAIKAAVRSVERLFGLGRKRTNVARTYQAPERRARKRGPSDATGGMFGRAHVGLIRGMAMEWLDDDTLASQAAERSLRRRMRQLGAI